MVGSVSVEPSDAHRLDEVLHPHIYSWLKDKDGRWGSQESRQDKEKSLWISPVLFSSFKCKESILQAWLPSQHLDHTRKIWISNEKGSKKSILFYLLFYLLCSSSRRIESFLCWEYTTEHVESCNISRTWMVQEYLQSALSFKRSYDPEMWHNAKSKMVNEFFYFFRSEPDLIYTI